MGVPASAVLWFERLINQGKHTEDERTSMQEPPQPTIDSWRHVLNQFYELNRVDDSPGQIPNFMRRIAYFANIRYLQTHEVGVEQAVALLDQALSTLNTKKYVSDKDTHLSIMFISCSNVGSSRL
ncbi:hypothetical protein BGY98DRAFT_1018047, partial [Russula aff. rugulosa BPL654]